MGTIKHVSVPNSVSWALAVIQAVCLNLCEVPQAWISHAVTVMGYCRIDLLVNKLNSVSNDLLSLLAAVA